MNLELHHPTFCAADDIELICRPLKKLNITYFAHVRISADKKFSTISTNPAFTAHYLRNQYYKIDIHAADETKIGNFFVWDSIEFSAQLCAEASVLGVNNPFTIIQRREDAVNYYHFANHRHNKQLNQIYLANLDLLQLFIDYFNDQVAQSKTLQRAYDLTVDLIAQPCIAFEHSIGYEREEFLQDFSSLAATATPAKNVLLSKRQKEVLQWVLSGKTVKQIAKMMGLSDRTVGHYFDALKIKFNVSSRAELVSSLGGSNLLFDVLKDQWRFS